MKTVRDEVRKLILEQFRTVRTCSTSSTLCNLISQSLAVLSLEDVREMCRYVSSLCREYGCISVADECLKAAESTSESEFLEHCKKAKSLCPKVLRRDQGNRAIHGVV